jgi:hypothetical protein
VRGIKERAYPRVVPAAGVAHRDSPGPDRDVQFVTRRLATPARRNLVMSRIIGVTPVCRAGRRLRDRLR